jgi:hypothetical protein
MLDRLYTKFDRLSVEHGVFKVETIGDGGPPPRRTPPRLSDDSILLPGSVAVASSLLGDTGLQAGCGRTMDDGGAPLCRRPGRASHTSPFSLPSPPPPKSLVTDPETGAPGRPLCPTTPGDPVSKVLSSVCGDILLAALVRRWSSRGGGGRSCRESEDSRSIPAGRSQPRIVSKDTA